MDQQGDCDEMCYIMSFLRNYIISGTSQYLILLTKTTAAQNEVALSYHRVRGLYVLVVFFVATIIYIVIKNSKIKTVRPYYSYWSSSRLCFFRFDGTPC